MLKFGSDEEARKSLFGDPEGCAIDRPLSHKAEYGVAWAAFGGGFLYLRLTMGTQVQTLTPVLTIGAGGADGIVLKLLPSPARTALRSVANRLSRLRMHHLKAIAATVYPILQKLEGRALPEEEQKLQGLSYEAALKSDEAIERALRMFISAWKMDFIRLVDDKGRAISPYKARVHMGACGMTVEEALVHFIDEALELIFVNNQRAKKLLLGTVRDPELLSKFRVLSAFQSLALTEMVLGLGRNASAIMAAAEPEKLYALATLKAFHMRALRQAFGAGFRNIFEWTPETIVAIGESFTCVEQVRDLGDAIGMVRDPQSMIVIGEWEKRDITARINEERAARGRPPIKGHRFETDIGAGRAMLGPYFNTLLENPPAVLQAFGKIISQVRKCDKVERKERIDEIRMFCDRFMEYMNMDTMAALGIVGENPTGFGDVLGVLEGVFSKPGLGRKFFEGALQTPEGVQALKGLMDDMLDMKRRGSIKPETDIRQLISNSDILDRCIAPFVVFKN